MGKPRHIRSADGFTINAYEALPYGEPIGSVVVIQEIFGVNDHIREVTDGYAEEGYAAIAPQIFDRAERNVELGYESDDITKGAQFAFQGNRDLMLLDIQATIEEIGKHGDVGVVGYCFGGLLTWLTACQLRGVKAASAYYGGGIAGELENSPRCPIMMHFGELDAHIPMDQVDSIRKALPNSEIYVYAADHGFNCDHRGSYDAEAAALAKSRTLNFFKNHLTA